MNNEHPYLRHSEQTVVLYDTITTHACVKYPAGTEGAPGLASDCVACLQKENAKFRATLSTIAFQGLSICSELAKKALDTNK